MDTKAEIEKVRKERDYYRKDFQAKKTENIIYSIKICFDKLETFLKNKGFVVEINELNGIAKSIEYTIYFYPKHDYKKEPDHVRCFIIIGEDNKTKQRTEFIIGIFSNKPWPDFDFNILFENPNKGKSQEEIELIELKKDLAYYKEYVTTPESLEYRVYQSQNVTYNIDLGYDTDLDELYEKIFQ